MKEHLTPAAPAIEGENVDTRTIREVVYYRKHKNPRITTGVFTHTKKEGKRQHLPCMISGQQTGLEYHHFFCEYSFADAVDWETVKKVAIGETTQLPVLDLKTHLPTGEFFDAEHSLLWLVCKLAELRGFNWHTFDPAKPETFVDSIYNMLVLHEKFHRAEDHGIHMTTFPIWIFQAFPRVAGFIFSPDEIPAAKVVTAE